MRIKDAKQTFLGVWIRLLVEGKPFEVWEGQQIRDFSFVSDVVDAMLLVAVSEEANGQVFNLGGELAITLKDLADLLVKVTGGGSYVLRSFPGERKRIDIGDYYANFEKIQSTLGWGPKVSLEQGLHQTVEFYRAHLAHYL